MPRRLLAAATGLSGGSAAGLLVTDGDLIVLVIAALYVAVALFVSFAILPREARSTVLPLAALAIALRMALAIALYDGLLAAGRGGFLTGDDASYADVSSRLARLLHGEPAPFDYATESYLLGTYVYLETGIFYLLGPKVLVVELLNAAMGGLLVAFVFDIARRLFDMRAGLIAAVVVALYPSLVLWSALNLKDSLSVLIIGIVLWLLVIFQGRRQWWWLVPASFAPLVPLASLRDYIYVGLALVIPASVILAPVNPGAGQRAVSNVLAVALSAIFLITYLNTSPPFPSLSELEQERAGMGAGANTNFADFCSGEPIGNALLETARDMPCAAAHVLFAPFPWSIRRTLDLLPLPEMLVWYAALVGGVVTLVRFRRSWRSLVPLVLYVGGTILVFMLAEGNVGTLFRHRAMVIPFVIIAASPAFALLFARHLPRTVEGAVRS